MVATAPSKMDRETLRVVLLLCAMLSVGSCSGQVPLVMWPSEGYSLPQQSPPAAGHVVSASQLVSYLSTALTSAPHNVLLFLQDKLSVDDFTVYGGVFGNKQDSAFPNLEAALQTSSNPLVLPSLSWPDSSAVLSVLQEQLGTSPLYLDPETLSQLRLNASGAALLVFRLPYSTGVEMSPKAVLSGNDEVIGQVLNTMKAQAVPYTVVYTASRPSRAIQEEYLNSQPVGRSLLQAQPSGNYAPLLFNNAAGNPCILLWASNLTIGYITSRQSVDLTPLTFGPTANVSVSNSFCNGTNSRMVLSYGSVLGFQSLSLIFSMRQAFYTVSARNWFTLDQVQVVYNGQMANFNGSNDIYAPAEYSYRCESVSSSVDALLVARNATDNANQWVLSFSDFQIQGFNVTGLQFSYASDCASFFTQGIWMGLVTSLLLLLILTYGLHMIMQLRTMDRFDDPKGPAITVPQTE